MVGKKVGNRARGQESKKETGKAGSKEKDR
jgi:hypothetical protein